MATLGKPGYYVSPSVSPDASRIAVVRGKPQSLAQDIWIHDLEYGREYRLTFEKGDYDNPSWSPDGSLLLYGCIPASQRDVCITSVESGSEGKVIYESTNWNTIGDWTPDGKRIVFTEQYPETSRDLLLLDLDDSSKPSILVRTPFDEVDPVISPDGRWLAYLSDETGRYEVYVREAGEGSHQWQVSVDGGLQPRWRGDGRELFFAEPDGDVVAVAVAVEAGSSFRAGPPETLFTLPEPPLATTPLFEDVTPDGQRFLLNLPVESRTSVSFHAVLDWPALLSK